MNKEIVITWCNGKPAGFWYGDKLIWETVETIVDVNLLKTTVTLPFLESLKFSIIFLNEIAADNLLILLVTIQKKIEELNKLKNEAQETDCDIDINEGW